MRVTHPAEHFVLSVAEVRAYTLVIIIAIADVTLGVPLVVAEPVPLLVRAVVELVPVIALQVA